MDELVEDGQEAPDGSLIEGIRVMGLTHSITMAFRDVHATHLRRWYVETFVLDPSNREALRTLNTHSTLRWMHESDLWPTVEHKAIGERLLYEIDPDSMVRPPDLLDPDHWGSEDEIALTMIRLFRPWESMRYDPEGENWYTAAVPGQWRRHGKGGPSNNAVEERINRWLSLMDPGSDTSGLYGEWPINTKGRSADEITALVGGAISRFRKFRNGPAVNRAKIRQVFERTGMMHLDTSTMNRIRTIAPFANGALALVPSEYRDTLGTTRHIKMGDLLPMDIEYMVTNANPLPWVDPNGRIPEVANDPLTVSGDFVYVSEHEDYLLLSKCPTYWSFLTHVFPDPDERSAFLRVMGAAMFGTNLKIVTALIGEPNAGKDTAMNWLNYLMPGQVATLPFSAFTPHGDDDRGFAPLRGARVATVSGEVGEGRGSKLLAEKIKTVSSGGGKIRVAEKYEKPSDIWFDGMLFLQGNSVPSIAGGDKALYTNRLVAIEFKHPFPLVSKQFEPRYLDEAPYFAQVLFLNYLQYQHAGGGMAGIDPPPAWRSFAKEFADTANPHGFIEAAIIKSSNPIPTSQFHQALTAIAGRFGSPYPVGPNYWPKRLRALGFQMKGPNTVRKQVTLGGKVTWCYYLSIDAELSDGMFTQAHWEQCLRDAGVTA